MLKRILALLLCLCLAAGAAAALAEPVNISLLPQQQTNDKGIYVSCAAAIGDTVYVLTSEAVERWAPGDTETTPMPIDFVNTDYKSRKAEGDAAADKPAFNRLVSSEDSLYGLCRETGELWKLADRTGVLAKPEKAPQLDWSGMTRTSVSGGYEYTPQFGDTVLVGGVLYVALTDWEDTKQPYELCGWDIATGKLAVDYKNLAMRTLAPYKDGLLIGKLFDEVNSWNQETQTQTMPQLATCDPKTGETKVLMDFTSANIYAVRYDAAADTIYYVDGSVVYRMSDPAQPAAVSAYLPSRIWDDASVNLLPGGMYVVANYSGVVVRGLNMPGVENGALTVYGEYGSAGHLAYVQQYPQSPVTCSEQYYNTLEEFTAAMVSGSDTVDVLRLNSDYAPLGRLIDKGYALDLSAYPELTDIASRMDPAFVSLCTRDGKLYGLPVDVSGYAIGYNEDAWEKLGLTEDDLPATFDELLDFVANWQADYGEEHTDLMLTDNGMARDALTSWLMDAYAAEQLRAGQKLSFDTELFRKLMQKMESIDFSEIDVPPEKQDDSFWNRMAVFSTYTSVTYPQQYRYSMKFLALPLTDGLQPVMPATVEYLVINPRTTHLDQAVQYLSVFAQNLDPTGAGVVIYPDTNEPIVNPTFEADKKDWEGYLADFKTQLEKAKPEEQASIKQNIEFYENMLAHADTYRYTVSAEDIAMYREQVAPYLVVTGQTPLKTWDKEGKNEFYSLRDQYMQGALTLDQFVKEMDKRLRMMQLEDE